MVLNVRLVVLIYIAVCGFSLASAVVPVILSTSPSGKLAVVIYAESKDEDLTGKNVTPFLAEVGTGKSIGPLEEVRSDGEWSGAPGDNTHVEWSKNSRFLIINFRAGRRASSFEFYEIRGRHAVPIILPEPNTHPKYKTLPKRGNDVNSSDFLHWKGADTVVWESINTDRGNYDCIYKLQKNGHFILRDLVPKKPM